MKTIKLLIKSLLLALSLIVVGRAPAANVTVYDSVVSLATNVTKNYTFGDPTSGQNVMIAVTMTPYSASNPSAVFSLLDYGSGNVSAYTHLGVDGNLILPDPVQGVNFSASLVSISSGVTAGTVQFRIAGLGLRTPDTSGSLTWNSSVSALSLNYTNINSAQALDTTSLSLNGGTYLAQLLVTDGDFQLTDEGATFGQGIVLNATFTAAYTDPQLTSWLTACAGKYARIYTNDLSKTNGASLTTWTNTSTGTKQSLPAYVGVQEVDYSTNWIYVRTTDLADYTMGPWYNDATRTTLFIAFPTNQHAVFVLPRTTTLTNPPAIKTVTYGSVDIIGYFVNGVAMFDALDGWVWNGSSEQNGGGYQWRRAAYPNEMVTFDPSNSHQQNLGEYHNHADPISLRYTLGDHVNFNSFTKAYTEATNSPTKHSPILGWVRDGYPIYGPYGYSDPTNANSGIRRMISGYQLRNGQNGSDNLTNVGRTLPAWMLRNNNNTAQSGPAVSTTYPLGRYLQDYAYLGDLPNAATGVNYQLGVDFDLNEFDVRWCVTPEFPQGTYAYFVTIDASGTPIAPWNVGMFFYGDATGTKSTNITETVKTNFVGVPNIPPVLKSPTVKNGVVTLAWSATEGGAYRVESTTNFTTWTTNSTNVSAVLNTAAYTNTPTGGSHFYRVAQTALANYDPVNVSTNTGGTGGGSASVAPGGSASRGSTVTVTITLPSSPPNPPANAPITSVTLAGSISGSDISDATAGKVIATFVIPANAATGAQNVVVVFGNSGPTYTLTGGFTIN